MRMNRRNVLVGLGTIVAGGGAALGTGAFSTVEADRTANISVADDANGFLAVEPSDSRPADGDDPYLSVDNGEIVFYFNGSDEALDDSGNRTETNADGLNDNAMTKFSNIITITNNGTNDVSITITPYNGETELSSAGFSAKYESGKTLSEGDSTDVSFIFDLRNDPTQDISNADTFLIEAN